MVIIFSPDPAIFQGSSSVSGERKQPGTSASSSSEQWEPVSLEMESAKMMDLTH